MCISLRIPQLQIYSKATQIFARTASLVTRKLLNTSTPWAGQTLKVTLHVHKVWKFFIRKILFIEIQSGSQVWTADPFEKFRVLKAVQNKGFRPERTDNHIVGMRRFKGRPITIPIGTRKWDDKSSSGINIFCVHVSPKIVRCRRR